MVVFVALDASGYTSRSTAFHNADLGWCRGSDTARPGGVCWGGWVGVMRGVDRVASDEGEGADQVRNIDLTGLEPPILAQILQTQFLFPHSPG